MPATLTPLEPPETDPAYTAGGATDVELAAALEAHRVDTTVVHGIADTAQLVLTSDGRLTNSRPPAGAAGGVLSGTFPDPGFAVDMGTQAEVDAVAAAVVAEAAARDVAIEAHRADTTVVHGIVDTADLAHLTGAETFSGAKRFDAGITFGADVALARSAAATLALTSHLAALGQVSSMNAGANQILLGTDGKLYFGSALDTNLYRAAANTLKSDDTFESTMGIRATGYTPTGWAGEGMEIGHTGGSGYLLAFNRTSSAYTAMTVSGLTVAVTSGATVRFKVDTNGIGFFSATPVAKQAITGSRGGNAALADLLTKLGLTGLITDSTTA